MAHLQYMPGDPRLVDQLVYELKSKGIFDQFRKECIADVDTRPAYQNLRQRVESSVSTFLTRQTWKSDLNKNQLREKLRKHILDGNYLEQGVERIVDQVVNPKVASVFIPQVEDLVYNYLGIPRKKTPKAELAEKSAEDLLPTDLEAVSPGSVKSNAECNESENKVQDMDIDSEEKPDTAEEMSIDSLKDELVEVCSDSGSIDKSTIPLPTEEIKLENIPAPENSPQPTKIELENIELPKEPTKPAKIELKNIELPREPNLSTDIPLPDETKDESFFKPMVLHSEDSNSSSSSSIRRNMSPLTPVRNFDDENSCDAQQAFENISNDNHKEPSSFNFNIENKDSTNDSSDVKTEKKETEHLSYQFNNQVKINTYNTPLYDDSSNSHNLQIDYESDANTNTSKTNDVKHEVENLDGSKKERKDDKKPHKSSHRSRDSSRHSSSKDKHSNSRDSSKHNIKSSSKDDKSKSSKEREKSKDRNDKKDSSKHKSSHKNSSSSSKDKHRTSSSSHRHSSKSSDDRKSSSKDSKEKGSEKDKERNSDKDKSSRDRKDSKSSSSRDKDKKSSKKDKDKKKDKKDTDDHYSSSGRGNHSRRSTDRDSNDGSSSSKGSQNQNNSKSTKDSKKESKSSSKSDNTSTSGESASPSDKEQIVSNMLQFKPIIRVDNHLETPIANPPRLPFVPDVTLKKPKFANNFEEAKRMMKMRKFLAEEQKRMNQEAALLLEFQANVRPSLSQVYSSIPGPELEFACVSHTEPEVEMPNEVVRDKTIQDNLEIVCEAKHMEDITGKVMIETKSYQITRSIINDIIGVPVIEETNDPTSDVIVETETIEAPNFSIQTEDSKHDDSYDVNKPISQLVDEISRYGKTSESTVDPLEESIAEIVDQNISTEFEITVAAETLSEADVSEILEMKDEPKVTKRELQYFAEHEKFNAELEKHQFGNFLNDYIESTKASNKMYVMNCNPYEESIMREIASKFGDYEIVNYHKNGHLVPNKNIVKDVHLCDELSLPIDSNDYEKSPLFSPVKSECSFELSSDYDAKLDEIVNKKSRQEVMEIILGGIIDESPSKMPTIDYYTEISDSEDNLTIVEDITEEDTNTMDEVVESSLKRKVDEEFLNDSRSVLTPNKIRKISESDLISSTTEESEEVLNNNKVQSGSRSKYLGRAKRVGLPRPKRCTLPNSPSSDKSVENYALNTPAPPNGKLKTPRSKVQRYDTSDLYKPKLHYLSRRNNIS